MKKSLLILSTFILLSINVYPQWDGNWPSLNQSTTYSGGTGTISAPYILSTLNDFLLFAINCTNGSDGYSTKKYFQLETDIDLNNKEWVPIGLTYDSYNKYKYGFKGYFNGKGHIIKNLSINTPSHDYRGLFAYMIDGTIENLVLENANIICKATSGCLVGICNTATISNCYVSGTINGDIADGLGNSIGGIVGSFSTTGAYSTNYSYLVNCFAAVNVSGYQFVGGIVGNCMSSSILNCQSAGNVNGNKYIGGLAGTFNGVMNNCFSSGRVTASTTNCGGLLGFSSGTVTNSYWDLETSGQTKGAGNDNKKGSTGKTTAEMKSTDFVNTLNTNRASLTGFLSSLSFTEWVADNSQTPINKGYPIFSGQTLKNTTGIKELNIMQKVKIFPNPASDCIHVKTNIMNADSGLFIYDCNGRQIFSDKFINGSSYIDITNFAKGIYYVRTSNQNGNSYKFLKL